MHIEHLTACKHRTSNRAKASCPGIKCPQPLLASLSWQRKLSDQMFPSPCLLQHFLSCQMSTAATGKKHGDEGSFSACKFFKPAIDSPIGDGRWGERVASTPMRPPLRRGTCTLAFSPSEAWSGDHRRCRSVLQWKTKITHTWEYCSRPSKQPAGMSCLRGMYRQSLRGSLHDAASLVDASRMPQ